MVNRTLPRGQKAAHLISCTTDEVSYRDNEASMSMLMNHPDVDGVYETQVPHILRALAKLGNKCNPDTRSGVSLSRGLDQGFHLHELATPTAMLNKRRYLDGGRNLKYGYIYHSNQDSRHMLCLILPFGEARMYVVDKGRNREITGMEKYYQEAKAALETRRKMESRGKLPPSLFDYPETMKVEVTYHAEVEAVYRHLSKELNTLHTRRQGPTILTICSARSRSIYEASIANLQHFPVVMEPSSKVDNTYPTRLMWQNPAARRMIQHYLRIGTWMNEKLEIAHRADVPM
jgi:DNA polymerase epsilon subunit 1